DGTISWVRVAVAHPGFAPIEMIWSGEDVPAAYTVALGRGVEIGGSVHDEQGRPIAGAQVSLQIGARPPQGMRYPEPDGEVAAPVTGAGAGGRSQALPASAPPGVELKLVTTHPDHTVLRQPIAAESLRAFPAAGVMRTGRSVSGTVTSPTRRPVA